MELVSGKVVGGCSNAGNPFHECSAICFERLSSGDAPKKDKKLFGFGRRTPSRDSPARGSRSPLATYFTKKKVGSDSSPSTDHTNSNFFSRLSPLQGRINHLDSLPISPSLAVYSGADYFASTTNPRGGDDDDMSPRPFGTHPKTPAHPLRTPKHRPQLPSDPRPWAQPEDPISLETRPWTPERPSRTRPSTPVHESAAIGRRPQTPDTRPRTAQHRGRSPEFPGPRSKTPEPQPNYFEPLSRTPKPRSKTPEPSPRIPQPQPISHRSLDSAALQTPWTVETPDDQPKTVEARPKTTVSQAQAYSYHGSKAESVYIDNDDESVLLYPELLLSPQEKPHSTPNRCGYETPTKQDEHFDSASTDDDKFSFVDEHEEDSSVWFYPEITKKSGSKTPLRKSKEEANNEPPELADESQSFSLSEISRMKGILVVKQNETKEEIQSILSESQVSVGDYKVRASVSATLQHILDKYGDIASASKLHSVATRSYYLEMLASVVLELQTTPLKHLKESRVEEMVAIIRDVESVKIKAGWLRPVMEEIVEAVKYYDEHERSIVEKEAWERDVAAARQEMEKQVKEVRETERKLKEQREAVTEMAGKLGALDMTRDRLDKSLAFLSSKVDKFEGEPLLQGIL